MKELQQFSFNLDIIFLQEVTVCITFSDEWNRLDYPQCVEDVSRVLWLFE